MERTISFYDSDPEGYSDATVGVDTSNLRGPFLSMIPEGGSILDLGCGSGRDSKAFAEAGYTVTPVDGSQGMCRIAERNTGLPVRKLLFTELDYEDEFDGVFACSSLLHVPSDVLPDVFARIRRALKPEGVFYASFKEGSFEGFREGRHYTDMTIETLTEFAAENGFKVVESWTSNEPGRDILWVNALMVKD